MLHVYPPLHGQLEGNAKFEFKDKRALFFCTFWHQQLFWVATLVSMGTILGRAIFIRGDVFGKCVKCQFQFSYVLGESCNLRNSLQLVHIQCQSMPWRSCSTLELYGEYFQDVTHKCPSCGAILGRYKKHRKTPLTSQYQTQLSLPF